MHRIALLSVYLLFLAISGASSASAEQLPTKAHTAIPPGVQEKSTARDIPPTFTRDIPAEQPTAVVPQDTYAPLPTYTPLATYTPYPTPFSSPVNDTGVFILPTLTPFKQFRGTESEFEAYLRNKYTSIGGRNLAIEQIRIDNEGGTYPHRAVSIRLSSDSANNVLGVQSEAIAMEYGRQLLADVAIYFGGQDCMVRVFELFYDDYLSDRYFDEDWYFIGTYYPDDGWAIQKDYVTGHLRNNYQSVSVWNSH